MEEIKKLEISNKGVLYRKIENSTINIGGYVDSDYVCDQDETRSIIMYLFKMNKNTVSWKFTLWSMVAISTTKDDHVALIKAIKDSI